MNPGERGPFLIVPASNGFIVRSPFQDHYGLSSEELVFATTDALLAWVKAWAEGGV